MLNGGIGSIFISIQKLGTQPNAIVSYERSALHESSVVYCKTESMNDMEFPDVRIVPVLNSGFYIWRGIFVIPRSSLLPSLNFSASHYSTTDESPSLHTPQILPSPRKRSRLCHAIDKIVTQIGRSPIHL